MISHLFAVDYPSVNELGPRGSVDLIFPVG